MMALLCHSLLMAVPALLLLLLSCTSPVVAWDSVEMEVFDVVEEVNQNFYELMGISQDATVSDVKKAYRTLSKVIHPDKSDAPDADIKFRQLVSVYEVLRDTERRGHYDRVLVDGLPDWRSAVYYYRRARKMSLLEIGLILTVVISISQYLMAWGSYWDTYKTIDDVLSRKHRSRGRQKKKGVQPDAPCPIEEQLASIPTPSMWNILPVQLCRGSYFLVRHGPTLLRQWRLEQKRLEQEKIDTIKEEEQLQLDLEREEAERKARKLNSRRRVRVVPEMELGEPRRRNKDTATDYAEQEPAAAGYATGVWTSEEFCELSKLMNKYPGGTVDRWGVIAEELNRAPHEVTKMAVKMRDRLAKGSWLQEQEEAIQTKIKVKTRAAETDDTGSGDDNWSTVQQRALEKAIKANPKGTDQRWEKIGKQVPEKSAEDCINRFKFLAERIRKKKEEELAAEQMATQRDPEWQEQRTGEDQDEDGTSGSADDNSNADDSDR